VSVYTFFYHIRLFVVISEVMLCLFVLNLQYADFPLYEIHCVFFSRDLSIVLEEKEERRGGKTGWFNLAYNQNWIAFLLPTINLVYHVFTSNVLTYKTSHSKNSRISLIYTRSFRRTQSQSSKF